MVAGLPPASRLGGLHRGGPIPPAVGEASPGVVRVERHAQGPRCPANSDQTARLILPASNRPRAGTRVAHLRTYQIQSAQPTTTLRREIPGLYALPNMIRHPPAWRMCARRRASVQRAADSERNTLKSSKSMADWPYAMERPESGPHRAPLITWSTAPGVGVLIASRASAGREHLARNPRTCSSQIRPG